MNMKSDTNSLTLTSKEMQVYTVKMQEIYKMFPCAEYEQRLVELRREIIAARNNTPYIPKEGEANASVVLKRFTRQISLPLIMPPLAPKTTAMSNWVAKSSVFAPRQKGRKRGDTGTDFIKIETPRNVEIYYNGPFLDMRDQALYLNLVNKASGYSANETIYIERAALLKELGYKTIGASSYKWLEGAFERLIQANIKIVLYNHSLAKDTVLPAEGITEEEDSGLKGTRKVTMIVRLVGEFAHDHQENTYYFTIPKASLALYSRGLFGFQNLKQREALKKGKQADLAAWLQSYICSDERGHHAPILVETFHRLSNNQGRLDIFVKRLGEAFDNCQKVGIISQWEYKLSVDGKPMVAWTRPLTY